MIRKRWLSIQVALLSFLSILPAGDVLSAPLMVDVLLLREPNQRGFLTLFDVALILLLVASFFRLRKYSK